VNYADDLVICCRGNAEEALGTMRNMMTKLKLTVNDKKTRVCKLPEEKFDFLGYTFGRCYSMKRGRVYLGTVPRRNECSVSVEISATKPDVTKSGKIRRQSWTGSIG
jgi:RNA-directed DNA polymerase